MKYWFNIILFFAVFLVISCDKTDDEVSQTLNKTMDRTGAIDGYNIRVHVFQSRRAMQEACAVVKDMPVELNLDECAIWSSNKIGYGCDVYLVDIRHMTDNGRFSAWGHGLAHCMYGSFHEER